MARVFNKEIRRSITHSLGRFLAICIIVALGTGFYAGLRMTAPDMELSADQYYDGTNLYDLRVMSTMGLTDGDIGALEAVDGVEAVMPAYELDAVTTIGDEQYTIRIHSLDDQAAAASDTSDGVHAVSDDESYINRPLLMSGTWPTKSGECVISGDRVMNAPVNIGDTIRIVEGSQDVDEVLKTRDYTIVGFVRSSYYTSSTTLGSTSMGSGFIQQYMYVPIADFDQDDPYYEAFLTVQGAKGERWGTQAYQDTVGAVEDRVNALAPQREQDRYDEVRGDAQQELDDKKAEYDQEKADAESQLADAKAQLDSAAAAISSSEAQIASGQAAYDAGIAELNTKKAEAEAKFAEAEKELDGKQAEADAGAAQLADAEAQLKAAQGQYQNALAQWQAAWGALDPADPQYPAKKAALEAQKQVLDATKAELDGKQQALDAEKAKMAAAQEQLDAAWGQYRAQKQAADAELAAAQARLDAAAAQLASGRSQLAAGQQQYASGVAEYEESQAEADEEFADAEGQIDEAQQEIDDIEMPTWYVMDRTKNAGAEGFKSDAQRVDQIAQVFPFLFFLVAALVALTTMTRMVEEERMQIGTYKALGYSRFRITSKYLIYAAVASCVGSVLGIVTLSQVLPTVIFNAYAIMYQLPHGPTPIDPFLATLSAGLGIGVTLIATWGAAASTLRETPASLMLPKAPKPGKRILLERIGPLWKRVSFSWKVTFRNIFRYKRRFIMTIIGIAGCTALMLTGFGLSDSINDIISKQYTEIYHYNTSITLADDISPEDEQKVADVLDDQQLVSSYTRLYGENVLVSSNGTQHEAYLAVPQDPESFQDFVTMRTRVGHQPLTLSGDDAIVSEKLTSQLSLKDGDSFDISEEDMMGNATGVSHSLVLGGIMENYIGEFVYITPESYEAMTGEAPEYTTVFAVCSSDPGDRQTISDDLLAIDGVKTVSYNDESIDSYSKMLASVNSIVVVLIVAAAVLAFVVLYNLTNINITERQREIATLKVLGFLPREVDAYIFRETMLLTIIGALFGLVLGVFMENYVVVTAEVDQIMFGREIHVLSFVVAFALTVFFSIFVSLAMRHKLNRIDMVESLKSNE